MFDLDETLIHCNEGLDVPSDVILPICFPSGDVIEVRDEKGFIIYLLFACYPGWNKYSTLCDSDPAGPLEDFRSSCVHSKSQLLR